MKHHSLSRIVMPAAALLLAATARAEPVVSNVRSAQVAGTHKVEIRYDLANPGGGPCTVSMAISLDGGQTFGITPPASAIASGSAHGANISPGSDKLITFLPAASPQLASIYTKQVRFRVDAVAGGGGPSDPNMVTVQGGTLAMSMGTMTVGTFQIGRHEVTWGEWKAARAEAATRGYDIGTVGAGCADNHPVRSVNWYDVVKWCNLKSEIEGLTPVYTLSGATYKSGQSIPAQNLAASGYRLPLEAEWEFAARGGNQTNGYTYSGSNTINDVAWYWDNASGAACPLSSGRGTWPVGGKAPNELGLHDMSGNVWEWCWDASGSDRRIRGGSWSDYANDCAVSDRISGSPGVRWVSYGFRLARSSGN